MALNLGHQTPTQFATRVWLRAQRVYESGDRITFARIVWWLYISVQSGDLTNNEVRVAFNDAYGRNLNAAQWTTFSTTRLLPIRDRYQAMLDEANM